MKVLLTGASGQLGRILSRAVPDGVELIPCSRNELDLSDAQACGSAVQRHHPDWVLNAAAYTAVDRAEAEPELAMAVNAAGPAALAAALAQTGGRLLQISTDFVFSGRQGSPWRPEQTVEPLGVYGASKAAGERAALVLPGARVLRTSWLHGPVGRNFCRTMLRLHGARSAAGEPLPVVADQVSCPTATHTLARACWRAIGVGADPDGPRILHWSDDGVASWYDFALAIGELGSAAGLIAAAAEVYPIPTSRYPTAARRPSFSLLDCATSRQALGLRGIHWRNALAAVLSEIAGGSG